MKTEKQFKGVMVPILTPLKPDETVDVASMRRLVNYLIEGGVHGIWAAGTTGEFAALEDSERIIAIETVVEEVDGRIPVIANLSAASTKLVVKLCELTSDLEVDGIAATPPYYYPNAQDELIEHFKHIKANSDKPLWIYNIPSTVKTIVEPQVIAKLAKDGIAVGVKDSSGSGEAFAQMKVMCDEVESKFYKFVGSLFRITSSRGIGADGVIPGIANLAPEIVSKAWTAGEEGNSEVARIYNEKIFTANRITKLATGGGMNAGSFSGMKAALKKIGIIEHDTVTRPLRPLSTEEQDLINPIIKEINLSN